MIKAPPRSRANAALSPTRAWTVVRLIGIIVLALDEVLGLGFAALSSPGLRARASRAVTSERDVAPPVTDRLAPVPDLAWEPTRARAFGAAVLDLWTELLERLRELPVSRELAPADVASALALEVPEEPMEPEALLAHLRELVFEQSVHVGHPAFLAYIVGAGTVPAAAAELLAAGLNPNVGGYRLSPGASQIELHLTRWLAGRFGLPEGAGGLVMTGGAMANFVALKCARDDRLGAEVREAGVAAAGPVALYASMEAHVVIRRAADMLGLGAGAVRALPVDSEQRLCPVALERAIAADRVAGTRYGLGDNYVDETGDTTVDQREIVDNSFLGLVLFGVKQWNDPTILNSLAVGDGTDAPIRSRGHAERPGLAPVHVRRLRRAGQRERLGPVLRQPRRQTRGRLWPLLTGERGEYELIAGRGADHYLDTIANTANDGLMLPEQVWDDSRRRARSRQGHALGDAAGVDARPVHPARVVDRRRPADRAPGDRRLPLPAGAVRPVS